MYDGGTLHLSEEPDALRGVSPVQRGEAGRQLDRVLPLTLPTFQRVLLARTMSKKLSLMICKLVVQLMLRVTFLLSFLFGSQ